MICGVYSITCLVSGKAYVGSSRDIRSRWNTHKCELRAGTHHCRALQLSWLKHGEQQFEFRVLQEVCESSLLEIEQNYLDTGKYVYNSAQRVNSPSLLSRQIARKHAKEVLSKIEWTEERRQKARERLQNIRPYVGCRPWTEERRKAQSERMKKRWENPKDRQELSKYSKKTK